MKKTLQTLLIVFFLSSVAFAQSISFTSPTLTTAEVGSTVQVAYKYTIASTGQIYCAIERQNGWTFVSTVASQFLGSATAGTDVTGTFNLTIPAGTTPTANLPSGENYKIKIELRNSSGGYLAGQFPSTQINITPSTVANAISFTGAPLTTAEIGTTIAIGYQYSLAAPGQIYCAIERQNGFTYVSTVVDQFLNSVAAGSNVPGTFNFLIPNNTIPTASLPSGHNYKIKIELRNGTGGYLTGQFPSTQINFTPNLSTSDFDKNTISVYPNPTSDFINLKGLNDETNFDFMISDMLGKVVLKNVNTTKIDVSALAPGLYFLILNSDSSQEKIKFVKK